MTMMPAVRGPGAENRRSRSRQELDIAWLYRHILLYCILIALASCGIFIIRVQPRLVSSIAFIFYTAHSPLMFMLQLNGDVQHENRLL